MSTTPGFDDYDLTDPSFSRGTVTSGVYPDNTYPLVSGALDPEQEKRLQARQEHDWATGLRPDHPPLTRANQPDTSTTPTADVVA